ncbi:MAG TPA: hypothetical protein VLD58_13365, partial [Gemmatimonadales bacterium]|nr:hypothetical protein [Gemmatimonadales bacterium]
MIWLLAGCLMASCARPPLPEASEARPNDNRRAAGQLHGDTLDLELELRSAIWRPELDAGEGLPVLAFSEPRGPAL